MLDIALIRRDPDRVRESLRRRGLDVSPVGEVLRYDEEYRSALTAVERAKAEKNQLSTAIAEAPDKAAAARELRPRLDELAQRIAGNASDAEELVQEAFLRLWTKADTWQAGRGRFSTWFFRILVNLCLDRKRRPGMLSLESAGEPVDPARGPVERIYEDELSRTVAAAIGELPERQRAALTLCYYEEMSNLEAAAALSVSVSALEALLVRARRTLRTKLAALGALGPKEGG